MTSVSKIVNTNLLLHFYFITLQAGTKLALYIGLKTFKIILSFMFRTNYSILYLYYCQNILNNANGNTNLLWYRNITNRKLMFYLGLTPLIK